VEISQMILIRTSYWSQRKKLIEKLNIDFS